MLELVPAKSILARNKDPRWFGIDYQMNLYRGCCHGCIYCDSRSECYGIEEFDRVRGKKNALALLEEVWVRGPEDCSRLLPPELPLCFTAKELGKAVGLSSKKASFAIRALRAWGAIRQVGKRGGVYLYSRVSPPGSFGPQTAAPHFE